MAAQNVQASVQFLKWQDLYNTEKPFNIFLDMPAEVREQRKTNIVFEDIEVSIEDIRGKEHFFTLDNQGFMVSNLPPFTGTLDKATIQGVHLPAVENLLKEKVEGADRVFIFDWRVRRGDDEAHKKFIDLRDYSAPLKPTNAAHIDTSAISAIKRVKLQLGEEASEAFKSRIRIVNVWQPVNHVVEDWPLALCDGSTVDASSLVETDIVRAGHLSSNLYIIHRNSNRWHYLPQQKLDEVWIFKQFDTKPDVRAHYCPHTSFKSPIARPDAKSRQSIEVRAIVLTDPLASV
ncbi:hypothetical protein HYALB_00004591 [Hymenoscyphus albidus]|uniref:Methyltransferase n=1 Tax=Hymenoscyphus albidus TaxID=595503 RepID=A0A9N9M0D1_9HELO|nr:hypothetical protein HYALB_00004591 [Hymenoscyphus albidus]